MRHPDSELHTRPHVDDHLREEAGHAEQDGRPAALAHEVGHGLPARPALALLVPQLEGVRLAVPARRGRRRLGRGRRLAPLGRLRRQRLEPLELVRPNHVIRGPLHLNLPVIQQQNPVEVPKALSVRLACDDARTVLQKRPMEQVIVDVPRSLRIHSSKGIIKKSKACPAVSCTCHGDTRFLATRKCYSPAANGHVVSTRQQIKVREQAGRKKCVLVPRQVKHIVRLDVFLERPLKQMRQLCRIGYSLVNLQPRISARVELPQQCVEKCRLATAHSANDANQHPLRYFHVKIPQRRRRTTLPPEAALHPQGRPVLRDRGHVRWQCLRAPGRRDAGRLLQLQEGLQALAGRYRHYQRRQQTEHRGDGALHRKEQRDEGHDDHWVHMAAVKNCIATKAYHQIQSGALQHNKNQETLEGEEAVQCPHLCGSR
mmetsp:Transcript_94389/g.266977  ORF Transcript_94389/g.266977 Transcript_94389/m.266977 type:complete len:429 (+) Transcript_94389:1658-2944(+)